MTGGSRSTGVRLATGASGLGGVSTGRHVECACPAHNGNFRGDGRLARLGVEESPQLSDRLAIRGVPGPTAPTLGRGAAGRGLAASRPSPLVVASPALTARGTCADPAGTPASAAAREDPRRGTAGRRASGLRPSGPRAAHHGPRVECRGRHPPRTAHATRPTPENDPRHVGPEAARLELPPLANRKAPRPFPVGAVGCAIAEHRLLDPAPKQPS